MLKARPQMVRRLRPPVEGLFCNYSHRTCMQPRLDGFDFCLKHILEDKNSPFKQCNYISTKTNKRCGNAAPKTDRKEGYCLEHSRRASFLRQKASRKKRPRETPEGLLEELDQSYPPMKDGKVDLKKARIGASLASKILDYGSSSDSDSEMALVDQAWQGDGESDAESIDSEQEDPLKHAGIYTAEEVTLIMRDKLIRLQSLYIEQFKRLQHIMKEKRRKYLHAMKQEKDTLGNVQPSKADLGNREKFAKLAALKRYHQRHGKEALLHKQSKERRVAVSEGPGYRAPVYPKCSHTTAGVRCNAMTLPLSKLCIQHVLDDSHQVLFQPCSFALGQCGKPVPVFLEPTVCGLHQPLTEFNVRVTKEDESQVLVDVRTDDEDVKPALEILEPVIEQTSDIIAPDGDATITDATSVAPPRISSRISDALSTTVPSTLSDGSSTALPLTLSDGSSTALPLTLLDGSSTTIPPTLSDGSSTAVPSTLSDGSSTTVSSTLPAGSLTAAPSTMSMSSSAMSLSSSAVSLLSSPSPQPDDQTPQSETPPPLTSTPVTQQPTVTMVTEHSAADIPKLPQDTRQILLQHLQGQVPPMVPPTRPVNTTQHTRIDEHENEADEGPVAMETDQGPQVERENSPVVFE